MSYSARRHLAPTMAILSNQGLTPKMGKETDHLHTWGDDQPNGPVHTVGNFRSTTIGDLIKEKISTSFPDTHTRLTRGGVVVED